MINIKKFLNLEYYTSQLDQFLAHYRREHRNLSESQTKEQEKYRSIHKLRDQPESECNKANKIWHKF
jgi:hypothetical protein